MNCITWNPCSSCLLHGYHTLQLFPCLKTPTLITEPQNVVFLRDSCCADLGCVTAWCWHQPLNSLDDELCVCLQKFSTIWFLCICHTNRGLCVLSSSLHWLCPFPVQDGRQLWLAPWFCTSTSRAVSAHSQGHWAQAKETAERHQAVAGGPYLLLLLQSKCLPRGSVLHPKMWCWIIPMGCRWSCVTPRLGTPIWDCGHTSEILLRTGCISMTS